MLEGFLGLFSFVVLFLIYRAFVRYMTRLEMVRVADRILDEFEPTEWFTSDHCTQRLEEDSDIVALAITHLVVSAHMVEYKLRPLPGVPMEFYQRLLAIMAEGHFHPTFTNYLVFRIQGSGQRRTKKKPLDPLWERLEGLLPGGRPVPA